MSSATQVAAKQGVEDPDAMPSSPLPPQPDRRLFRHELTPAWLQTTAAFAGEALGSIDDFDHIAWFGCRAHITPAVVAAVHPSISVHTWDPDPARQAAPASISRVAALRNLVAYERPAPPDDSALPLCDLVVIDGVIDSVDVALRDRVLAAAGSLLRPGGLLAIAYRTTVGWGEVAPMVRLLRHSLRNGRGPRRSADALASLEVLRARGATYVAVRPVVAAWLDDLLRSPVDEGITSYEADALRPLSHAQVSEAVAVLGADFIASAHLDDPLPRGPAPLAEQVLAAPTVVLRETLADLAVRRTARVDLFRLGRSSVGEQIRSCTVENTAVVGTSLSTVETVGAPWAQPAMAHGCNASGDLNYQALRRAGGARVSELWPKQTVKDREARLREALDAGLLHPARDSVPDGAEEAADRLTGALAGAPFSNREQFTVSARLGTALPSEYVESVDQSHLRALGVGGE